MVILSHRRKNFRITASAGGGITFVSAGVTANSSNANVSAPAGIVENDMLVAFVEDTSPGNITTPSGWTKIGATFTGPAQGYGYALFWKIATASEPSTYAFSTNLYRCGMIMAFRGATSIDNSGSITGTNTATLTLPGITCSAGSVLIAFIIDRDAAITYTQPAGMTKRVDTVTAGNIFSMSASTLENADSSNRIYTMSSSTFEGAGVLVSVK